jgi:ATP-dependent protease ClpP protease subunit
MDNIPIECPLVYVSFSAEINPSTTENLIAVMANCANLKVKKVCLLLSTPGGNVMNGLNLYNILKGMPFELTTHNVGNVDSIGNAVFLAGALRYACARATFMFHGVGFDMTNVHLEEKDLQERLESLLNDQRRIGAIITDRTKISERDVADLFRQAQTKDANYALTNGIISEVREVNIASGIPIVSLVFKR